MSTDPADLQPPRRPGDGDTAKRHGDELAEVVERDGSPTSPRPVEESGANERR